MTTIILKQKEGRTLKFTVTDSSGTPLDLTTATQSFGVKSNKFD